MSILRRLRTKLGLGKSAVIAWPHPGVEIGRFTYGLSPSSLINYVEKDRPLTVGSFCSVAQDVRFICRGGHRSDLVTSYPLHLISGPDQSTTKGPIVVGHDVWIGYGVIILAGVNIGNGAVIGAGSIVTRDIPPYAVAAGNPARVIKYRFDPETIARLQEIQWWNWPEERIRADIEWLRLPGPEFVSRQRPAE